MKTTKILAALAIATTLAPAAGAQVERIDLDIEGYLCGF